MVNDMKINVIISVIVKLFLISVFCTSTFGGLTPPPVKLTDESSNNIVENKSKLGTTIITPQTGAIVTNETIAKGSYLSSNDNDIWIFVWPENARNVGWPQSDSAAHGIPAFKKNGQWSVRCYFGGPPQSYEIAVYEATKSANNTLRDLLVSWYKKNDYPGLHLSQLPNGLVEKDRIKVIKK